MTIDWAGRADMFQKEFASQAPVFEAEGKRMERTYYVQSPQLEGGLLNIINGLPQTPKVLCEIVNLQQKVIDKTFLTNEPEVKQLRKKTLEDAVFSHWNELENIPMGLLEYEYWSMHNPVYLKRLSQLRAQLSEKDITELNSSSQIVIIPSMNEYRLHEAVKALDASLHATKLQRKESGPTKPIDVIVYFNHKENPEDVAEDVLKALDLSTQVNQHIRVHIVREQVAQDNTVQDSKKVALDIGLMLKGEGRDIPILMMDGDISEFSNGTIYKTTEALKRKPWSPRVISTFYDIPRELLKEHPAMYYYFKILDRIFKARHKAVSEDEDIDAKQKTYGGFILSSSRVLIAAGGFIPYRNIFEDSLFVQQLVCLMNGNLDTIGFWPVNAVKDFDSTAHIASTYSREIQSVVEGKSAMDRWGSVLDTDNQNKEAGRRRLDFTMVEHPLLQKFDQKRDKYLMFELVIRSIVANEFAEDWERSSAVQSMVFVAWMDVAIELGLTRNRAIELWEGWFPQFQTGMYMGRLAGKRNSID